jgi:hypothetical protein
LATIIIGSSWAACPARAAEKDIFGWVERVWVGESQLDLEAKLDTGADTSSLHASKIRRYRGKIEICLGDHEREVEVSRAERSGFQDPVLLGRNALEGRVVVDPELWFTAKPACPPREER